MQTYLEMMWVYRGTADMMRMAPKGVQTGNEKSVRRVNIESMDSQDLGLMPVWNNDGENTI